MILQLLPTKFHYASMQNQCLWGMNFWSPIFPTAERPTFCQYWKEVLCSIFFIFSTGRWVNYKIIYKILVEIQKWPIKKTYILLQNWDPRPRNSILSKNRCCRFDVLQVYELLCLHLYRPIWPPLGWRHKSFGGTLVVLASWWTNKCVRLSRALRTLNAWGTSAKCRLCMHVNRQLVTKGFYAIMT